MANKRFDQYALRARLQPATLAALPVPLSIVSCFPAGATATLAVWSLVAWCGGIALLAQLGRDAGKRKEPALFRQWGGKPTVRLLRHLGSHNRVLLERRHQKLQTLLPNVPIPTPDQERQDPHAADAVYETCGQFLLEKTRAKETFPLVFEANCDYGFRRNLWGMKPLALVLAFGAAAAIAWIEWRRFQLTGIYVERTPLLSFGLIVGLLVGWLFVFTPRWVKVTADAFAERLLAALENL